jgi:GNAT superfamily N-acetyltransferase
MTWHRPGFLKSASFLRGLVHSPRNPDQQQADERTGIARHDTAGLVRRSRPPTAPPSAELPPRAAAPRVQVASDLSIHSQTSSIDTPAQPTATGTISGPTHQDDHQVQAPRPQVATSALLTHQDRPASKGACLVSGVEVVEFAAARDQFRRYIEASPASPDRDEALFICDELGRYPYYPEEKLCVSQDSDDRTNGLLKLGAPVLAETFGIPPSVAIQQIVTHPTRQGAGTALISQAVNHSEAQRCAGNLRAAHDVGSEVFYERMGFEQIGPIWVLQPSTRPDLWEKTSSNEWRFKPG